MVKKEVSDLSRSNDRKAAAISERNDQKKIHAILDNNAARELMQQGNISLIIDTYDDIFSDFDPRPYSARSMSDDFVRECKRALRDVDPEQEIEVRMLVPGDLRNLKDEVMIKKRIRQHFVKHYHRKLTDRLLEKREGSLWFVIGILLSFIATIFYDISAASYLNKFLYLLLEPAGWFGIWTGFDRIFLSTSEKKLELDFHHKMSKTVIKFFSY